MRVESDFLVSLAQRGGLRIRILGLHPTARKTDLPGVLAKLCCPLRQQHGEPFGTLHQRHQHRGRNRARREQRAVLLTVLERQARAPASRRLECRGCVLDNFATMRSRQVSEVAPPIMLSCLPVVPSLRYHPNPSTSRQSITHVSEHPRRFVGRRRTFAGRRSLPRRHRTAAWTSLRGRPHPGAHSDRSAVARASVRRGAPTRRCCAQCRRSRPRTPARERARRRCRGGREGDRSRAPTTM